MWLASIVIPTRSFDETISWFFSIQLNMKNILPSTGSFCEVASAVTRKRNRSESEFLIRFQVDRSSRAYDP
jgi:hypothetical protein